MNCKPGKLVGIPFPYTDLTTKKRRPVLVMTAPDQRSDFIGVAVTSVQTEESAVAINKESMTGGQLPKQSWVRCDPKNFHIKRNSCNQRLRKPL